LPIGKASVDRLHIYGIAFFCATGDIFVYDRIAGRLLRRVCGPVALDESCWNKSDAVKLAQAFD
jgi:hypothetical protein